MKSTPPLASASTLAAPSPSTTSPPQDVEQNKVEKEEQSDDIYNDPLIKEALEVFEAVIREDS